MKRKMKDIRYAFPYISEEQFDFIFIDSNLYEDDLEIYDDQTRFEYK